MGAKIHIESHEYNGIYFQLIFKPKEHSVLANPLYLWYWEVENKKGSERHREAAIAIVKEYIDRLAAFDEERS